MGDHDALFKHAFSIPAHAAGELRALLPMAVASKLDLDALALVPGSFVDADLKHRHTDLLFKTTSRSGAPTYVYLLLEHQSEPDPEMPWRILVYMVRIWERHRHEMNAALPLPMIFPLVVHHGEQGWTVARRFQDLISGPEEMPEARVFMPDFTLLVDDLAHRSNAELQARSLPPFAQLTLWALRDARAGERLTANTEAWADRFQRLGDRLDELHILMRYIFNVAGNTTLDAVRATFARAVPESERTMTTIAEFLTQQGVERGIEKGIEQGKRDMLRRAFLTKFGAVSDAVTTRIEGATGAELDALLDRLLTAASLDDVLG